MSQIHPIVVVLIAVAVAGVAALRMWGMIKFFSLTKRKQMVALSVLMGFMGVSQLVAGISLLMDPNSFSSGWLQVSMAVLCFSSAGFSYYQSRRLTDEQAAET